MAIRLRPRRHSESDENNQGQKQQHTLGTQSGLVPPWFFFIIWEGPKRYRKRKREKNNAQEEEKILKNEGVDLQKLCDGAD